MARIALPVSLALGAMLAAGNAATAGENVQTKIGTSNGRTGASMTLGGSGTAARAAAAPDAEQVWYGYWRGYRRGLYNGFYGPGWGWGGFYGAAYYPYAYPYPYGAFYPPVVGFGARFGPFGFGVGINGTGNDVATPALSLNLATAPKPAVQPQPNAPREPATSRYDGGPASPIPLPKQDAPNAQPGPPQEVGLPVSLPRKTTQPAKPYAYKGYGEK